MQVTSRISDDSSQAKTALSPVALRRNMRLEQCGKLVELRQALLEAGLLTLNSQAGALGLGRSTAWIILKAGHKSSGLTASVIKRILRSPELPATGVWLSNTLQKSWQANTGTPDNVFKDFGHSSPSESRL